MKVILWILLLTSLVKLDIFYNRENELNELIYELQKTNLSFSELKEKYKIGTTTISLINNGKKYYNSDLDYPLRKNAKSSRKRIFTEEEMEKIKDLLSNSQKTMQEIANIIRCD